MEFSLIREKLMEKFILLEDHIKDFYLHVLVENSVQKTLAALDLSIEVLNDEKALKLYKDTLRDVVKSIPVHIMNIANIIRELQGYHDIMNVYLKNNPKNKHELSSAKVFEVINAIKRIRNKVTHNISGNISIDAFEKLSFGSKKWDNSWTDQEKVRFVEIALDHITALFDLYTSKTYLYLSESVAISKTDHKKSDEIISVEKASKKKRINLVPFRNWKKSS